MKDTRSDTAARVPYALCVNCGLTDGEQCEVCGSVHVGMWVRVEAYDSLAAEREKLAWVIRELHEGACSPAYRPPDSDFRLWALEVIEREASDLFPQGVSPDQPPASSESSHGSEDTDG